MRSRGVVAVAGVNSSSGRGFRLSSVSYRSVLAAAFVTASFAVSSGLEASASGQVTAAKAFGKMPLAFEENKGQTDAQVRFLSRGNGYSLFLTDTAAVLSLHGGTAPTGRSGKRPFDLVAKMAAARESLGTTDVVRMELAGATHGSRVTGADQLPGTSNYFIGNDPAKWRSSVPTFAKVQYEGVYPGVDLVYYGNQSQLEYDFVVAPNASPKPIRLLFDGAQNLRLETNGDLAVIAESGQVVLHKPVVYQTIDGKREPVEGSFTLLAKNTVGFRLGEYDTTKQLIIDPVLAYSTFLGGSSFDLGTAVAAGSDGSAYIVGITSSLDFPVSAGAYQSTQNSADLDGVFTFEAFVSKINPAGTALVYSTYLGGSGTGTTQDRINFGDVGDFAYSIAVDSAGNAYVAGGTFSTDFPVTSGAFQSTDKGSANGVPNGFVTKLNPAGTALVYSTYLGGTGLPNIDGTEDFFLGNGVGGDFCFHIVVDGSGNAYVTGETSSPDFPLSSNAFQNINMGFGNKVANAFVTKLNPTGSALIYSTFLGGSYGEAGTGIAVDSAGNAYVTGASFSSDFPVIGGAIQPTNLGTPNLLSNGFVSKFNPTGSALIYSTFLGGTGNPGRSTGDSDNLGDLGANIALDSAKNAYVSGYTYSKDFPVTTGAFQSTNKAADAQDESTLFVSKINPSGTSLVYSTYLGGTGSDQTGPSGMVLDASGNVYLTGETESTDFPVTAGAFQPTSYCGNGSQFISSQSAFVTGLNPTGTALVYSSYLGGSGYPFYSTLSGSTGYDCADIGEGIALDSNGGLYVAGTAVSPDFPTTASALQTTNKSAFETAFITKFALGSNTGNGTITGLNTNGNPRAPASTAVFTAHVQSISGKGIPSGTVTFSVDGVAAPAVTLDNTGSATFTSSALALGVHPVIATYSGGSSYTASSSSLNEIITKPIGNLEKAIDAKTGSTTVSQTDSLYVGGWAVEPYSNVLFEAILNSVQIYVDGTLTATTTTGGARPDVATSFGKPAYKNSGFSVTISASSLSVGQHQITAVASDTDGATTTLGPLTITVAAGTAPPPFGNLEVAVDDVTLSTTVARGDNLSVSGWAADVTDGTSLASVNVLIDGVVTGTTTVGISRFDVGTFYNNNLAYINSGYSLIYPASSLSLGSHSVTVKATDSGGRFTTFGPLTITVVASMRAPVGNLEKAVNNATNAAPVLASGTLLVGGWAADYQDNGPPASVQVVIDGKPVGFAAFTQARPDVASAYGIPAWGNTGWEFRMSASSLIPGTHGVTAVVKDSLGLTTVFGPIPIVVQ